jgi:hypothetical protein
MQENHNANEQHQKEKTRRETSKRDPRVKPVLKSRNTTKTKGLVFHQISINFVSFYNKHGLLRYSQMYVWLVLKMTVLHCRREQAARSVMLVRRVSPANFSRLKFMKMSIMPIGENEMPIGENVKNEGW